jgi:hypothetical protein
MNHACPIQWLLTAALLAVAGTVLGAPDNVNEAPKNKKPVAMTNAADKLLLQLTIYNENFALVKDRRELPDTFKAGLNTIHFRDVAASLDPTSVHFRSLTDPSAQVIEQNYEFDLVNADKLLQKYIDRRITAHTKDGKAYTGILLSFDDKRLVLAGDKEHGPIFMVERGNNIQRIQFSTLPEGLLTRPTLVWQIATQKSGKHEVEVSYIAQRLGWHADYNLVLNPDDTQADLSGWVTMENHAGTTYRDAAVKLLAGDTKPDLNQTPMGYGADYYKLVRALPPTNRFGNDPGYAFGDYRMYTLPERTTLNNNQIKQIELITASKVPVTKTFLYDGTKLQWFRGSANVIPRPNYEGNKKVNVLVKIQNTADNHLGIALPKGKVRLYKKDADGALEFIGEDVIHHTARDERLVLYVGDAFDIVGEHKQTGYQRINDRQARERFEIKLRNHKKEDVVVRVLEKMYRSADWTILQSSQPYDKLDSRTIVFPVKVPADKEATLTYQVEYRW